VIGISLTCTMEESKEHGVGTRDMRSHEMKRLNVWPVVLAKVTSSKTRGRS
jgi:hypothetical protein